MTVPSEPAQGDHPEQTYRIRVSDRLGPALCQAFAGMRAEVVPRQTVIEGWLSDEEFHALLRRVEQVGLPLVGIRRASDGRLEPT